MTAKMTTDMGPPPPRNPPTTTDQSPPPSETPPTKTLDDDMKKPLMGPPSSIPTTEPDKLQLPGGISIDEVVKLPEIDKKEQKSSSSSSSNNGGVPYSVPSWSEPPCHKYSLEVLKDGSIIDQFQVFEKGAYMFGRVDLCDFVLEHPTISRFHAVLQFNKSGGAFLYDLSSTHGTFINKNQVKKRVYVELHVGDVLRFGHSTRLYIFQGPSDLMPPEKELKSIRNIKMREERRDMEASLQRAKREAALADGISWGMDEDVVEENEEDLDEITWQTFKGQLTEKQEKTREKVLKRLEKIANMKKEIDAIRAKDISQGGLTQGQQTQIARNEQRMAQVAEELENLEETLNESIRESLGAGGGRVNGKKKGATGDDEDEYMSDEDDFYDRTRKKPSKLKGADGQSVETADSLLDKKDAISEKIEEKKKLIDDEKNTVGGEDVDVQYFQTYIDGVDFVFIRCHMFNNLGSNIYGGNREDILRRMVLFCKAAVEVPWYVPCGGVCYGDGNLVFIVNDWHTALLPVYLKAYYRDNGLMRYARSVLVIHNIAHQGRGPVDDFGHVDLPAHYLDLFRLYDPVGGEHFNIFAAGLKTADRVVTVSHGYAWELKTLEGGWGLHNIINENDWKLKGIVNGIDTKDWNPDVDVHLTSDGYTNYSLQTLDTGKPQCKAALQKELGLPVRDDVPLIGFIGRLDVQKGVDLIAECVPWIVDQDVQLVMLGIGRPDLEQMLRELENRHPEKIRGWVGFSVKTAHRITAGADILLMPSRFESCGLNQLYAMSYGTVPVVHAVGGLRDTVQAFDPYNESGLGWTFNRAEASQLIHALGNCLLTYREYKHSWEGIQKRGMMQDLSWDNAAQHYEDVFVAAKYHW